MKDTRDLLEEIVSGLSGKELAGLIGATPGFVSQMRTGEQLPTDLTLAIIAAERAPERLNELLIAAALQRIEKQRQKKTKKMYGRGMTRANARAFEARLEKATRALEALLDSTRGATKPEAARPTKDRGRTFSDFPHAFYPLAVVTGDRREEGESHISIADLGAYAATPADTRWIHSLELRLDVVKHIDKNFVLQPENDLIRRFANMNLLVVGSPAANHLARFVNRSAVFRFNYTMDTDQGIEDLIGKARELEEAALVAYKRDHRRELRARMRTLFTGGIFDPTHPREYVAASFSKVAAQFQLDFGILTFAANPYYAALCRREGRPNDHRYVSIMAAGIHHPATAHALKKLGREARDEGFFEKHPYGGVLRVVLNSKIHFTDRTERARCDWEDKLDDEREESSHPKKDLLAGLADVEERRARGELTNLALSTEQAAECRRLIDSL